MYSLMSFIISMSLSLPYFAIKPVESLASMYMKLSISAGVRCIILSVGFSSNMTPYSPPNLVNATPDTWPISLFISMALSMDAAPVIPTDALTLQLLFIPSLINSIAILIASFLDGMWLTSSEWLLSIIFPLASMMMLANVSIMRLGMKSSMYR